MAPRVRCPACRTATLLPAGSTTRARTVCARCGRCWETAGVRGEVDTISCPGCPARPVCESRPTGLVDELTSRHTLSDGTRILVRPLLYSDRYELSEGFQHLSAQSRRLRFFTAPEALSDDDLEYLTNIDYTDHFAWAAFAADVPGTPGVGVARYIRDPERRTHAEAAVTVLDSYQHRGLGTLLLLLLADRAQRAGVTTFVSYVLWDNKDALEGLREAGASIEADEPGIARVELDIPAPEEPKRLPRMRTALSHFASATRVLLGLPAGAALYRPPAGGERA